MSAGSRTRTLEKDECRVLAGAGWQVGVGLGSCPPSRAGLSAINELPLPACREPGSCPSAAIVSPRFPATVPGARGPYGGSSRHLSAHLVAAAFQFTRQQLLGQLAPLHHCPARPASCWLTPSFPGAGLAALQGLVSGLLAAALTSWRMFSARGVSHKKPGSVVCTRAHAALPTRVLLGAVSV